MNKLLKIFKQKFSNGGEVFSIVSLNISFKNLRPENLNRGWENIVKRYQVFSSNRLSVKEQTFFAKRLSFLIRANVPLLESLTMLREQTNSRNYGRVLDTVIDDISNGQFLSKSLSRFKKTFGEFAINIIKVGESSGILSQNLDYLADELKKKYTLRRKVFGAFIYPALITLATIGITVFLMVYLFPKIMPIFNSLHASLPLSTRIVIFLSDFLRHEGVLFFFIIALFVALFTVVLKKSLRFHFIFDQLVMKIPIIGNMIQNYNLANTTRTLGLLLKSGITLSEAFPIVADTTKNLVYKNEFQLLSKAINRGEKISTQLKRKRNLFPDILSQMIAVGERSGNLSNTLVYLSELYDAEVDEMTKNLSTLIEPILMIFMGILVGFIAISIITPIYGITQNLHG
jgi:type II secretory pathway component PulF